ncbi:MAG: hypothetical protein PQJ50_12425, partial [Spirochaetales bacterium]|nr:hypothetical protein [Spirochaetales bacterium]
VGGYWWDHSDKVKDGVGCSRVDPLDLENERLIALTRLLEPAYIRIGGTEADRIYYSIKKDVLPEGYHYLLGKKRWKQINRFCRSCGSALMLTINAGPGPRKEKERWRKKNARQLIDYADANGTHAAVWELGNEVNAFPFFMGLSHRLNPREYAKDIRRLQTLLSEESGSRIAGPALAVWPILGETLPFMKTFLKSAKKYTGILTWHYYPQQSSRSLAAVRRARKRTLLNPKHLDEAARQALRIKKYRDRYQPEAELWLGETGHALCGGQAGLSDTFYSGFWWLDQLGLMALCGQKQVIRQTLSGGDYGLLDKVDHSPLPDFWTTLCWNRFAGTEVYRCRKPAEKKVRAYCHSIRGRNEGLCFICINLDESKEFTLDFPGDGLREYALLTSPDIYSREIRINGRKPDLEDIEKSLAMNKVDKGSEFTLPPLSFAFLLLY